MWSNFAFSIFKRETKIIYYKICVKLNNMKNADVREFKFPKECQTY